MNSFLDLSSVSIITVPSSSLQVLSYLAYKDISDVVFNQFCSNSIVNEMKSLIDDDSFSNRMVCVTMKTNQYEVKWEIEKRKKEKKREKKEKRRRRNGTSERFD